ncbi:CDP-diacylglycerol--glycerol-3-phosphate 3-phosphatidyltransferase [Candidatus Thermokryptus mobilis]|uniref:CDP-diacylglycerol--glycerol-3-phosphate 3-phosphatidyltransferase n=1 Tax=Candidatus Thermokryptus mobilis TaxID=1643428 RepID=A0A0S4N637_9BACT|nr:CDP-diacylglycerol--glycerol-3-phosphate 3-phosphatidyltransferase [Candidatus Thermokryptus mobilis]CUU06248.1 CDP-diacylglycerol--glycerol-3-phosphate 3-phosphatidyltransferase [Candidatus Thermokryptus mobilis]
MTLPNQLTILRIFLTPVFVALFLSENVFLKQLSVPVYILAALTDWYDGWIARKFGYMTKWGRFLDPLADKILTSSAFIAFASLKLVETWMVVVIVVRDLLITILRSYAEFKDKPVVTTKSAKVKTFVQMVFIYYLLFGYVADLSFGELNLKDSVLHPVFLHWLMLFVTVLTLWTGLVYLYDNWKIIKLLYVATFRRASESA